MSRGCTDEAMPARAAQNQKQQVALQGFCACVKKPAGQHMMRWLISGIQPIQLLPVPEILHHLADPSPGSVCWSSLVNTLLRTLPKEMFRRKYCHILINPKLTPKLKENRREAYSAGQLI